MAKFNKKRKGGSLTINTSALPDIIFMLLFFFMVSTTMKETDLKVRINPVKATQIEKITRKDLTTYIYIGKPASAKLGANTRIQLNDNLAEVNDIKMFIVAKRDGMSEANRPLMTVNLKIDKDTKMGIVSDVKMALRQAKQYKIMYSAIDPTVKGDEHGR